MSDPVVLTVKCSNIRVKGLNGVRSVTLGVSWAACVKGVCSIGSFVLQEYNFPLCKGFCIICIPMEPANWAFAMERTLSLQPAEKSTCFLPSLDKIPQTQCFGRREGNGTPVISWNNLHGFTSALCWDSAEVRENRIHNYTTSQNNQITLCCQRARSQPVI